PMEGVFPFVDELDTVGAFARTADDVRTVQQVMLGHDFGSVEIDHVRVGVLQGFFREGIDPAVLQAVDRVAEELGAKPVELPAAAQARSASFLLTAAQGGRRHLDALREDPSSFDDGTRDRLLAGALLPQGTEAAALSAAQPFAEQLAALFEEVDLLVTPATPVPAPRIDEETIVIGGQTVNARAHLGMMTQPFGLSGVPSLSLPVPGSIGTLPIGVQMIANHGKEGLLFAVAGLLEKAGIVMPARPVGLDSGDMRESA
ncbi:MAG: amidase family protein, partial [Pseudomonadota bacterium]